MHLDHPEAGPAHDPFREGEAYAEGCRVSWVRECSWWLEMYPVTETATVTMTGED